MLNLILFGAPGAGKGTQAALLKEHYGLTHLSTGDMLRSEVAAATPFGKSIQHLINEGMLVSDEIIMQIISHKIAENTIAKGFIFDGIPRTVLQAQMLDDILLGKGLSVTATLALEAEEDELAARILSRGKTSGRPDDRSESVIRQRIRIYHEKTEPLTHYYKKQDKFFSVMGMGRVEDIFEASCKVIDNLR
jgi:adenylate kinase